MNQFNSTRLLTQSKYAFEKAQEETTQATQALKKAQEEIIEATSSCATREGHALQEKFEEDRAKIQKEKEQLLAKQIGIEEAVNRAFLSVTGLETEGRRTHRTPSDEAC
jgi:VIT1/CCC1 family predicted Fe2+/Mn2+ transporter